MNNELSPEQLRNSFNSENIECETTEDLEPLKGIIGQERAVKALKFGLEIRENGFNIFVSGPYGTGRETAIREYLEVVAKEKPVPPDWVYVNNFKNSYEPIAISLKPGEGTELKKDMDFFIEEAKRTLPEAFEGEDFARKRDSVIREADAERKHLFDKINRKAEEMGFVIQITQVGLNILPVVDGEPLNQESFLKLTPERKEEIQNKRKDLDAEIRSEMRELQNTEKRIREKIKDLNQEVANYAIGHLIESLKEKYRENAQVMKYLDDVRGDIVENLPQFMGIPQNQPAGPYSAPWMEEMRFRKYKVNVIVDNRDTEGYPVIFERNTSYQNLFGRLEKESQFGMLTTDFTMIRGGSLHKANGGYLVVPAEELLRNPISYDGLKRALRTREIVIEEAAERMGFISIKGLKPRPIPLDIKVILMGDFRIYQMLFMYDKEFNELFKVKADFDVSMDRNEENTNNYASFICTFCKKEGLNHLEASAVGRIIEHGSRLAGHQEKLTTRFADLADIIREANFYSKQEGSNYIKINHVQRAIEERTYRSNLLQEKINEMIKEGMIFIDIENEKVGQVNGLSVLSLGDFAFGRPSRVTASIGMGRDGIIDIEREANMGGPIHTKGVLILSGYLSNKHAMDKPLTLSARIVFEQSYEGVEGDSASSTELYAILSALSGVPIKQGIAVTGSVNQVGEVQPIGGVNEKIEGYFEVCKQLGFSGDGKQGVMIPKSNVQNLMLKEEIVEAVKEGKFRIYSVGSIDEGIEVLTGVKSGIRLPDGTFEKDSINYMVDKRLREMSEGLKEFQKSDS